jgi:hypothetical protein
MEEKYGRKRAGDGGRKGIRGGEERLSVRDRSTKETIPR